MKLEHVAINVPDPVGMAEWYERHLGMEIVRGRKDAPFTHFLRDSGGRMMIEIYTNPTDAVPEYADMDPLILHFAFVSSDPEHDKTRLQKAGATLVAEEVLEDGSRLVMLRDPWGVCVQLCKRATALLASR